ncbi:MAG: hypothetical protein JXQ27_09435 [Acidobacteria bacterium]|nr:hypothetical protein [Acidobacteriota bacterium]
METFRLLVLLWLTLAGIFADAAAQIGVIEAKPEEKQDAHCQLYISDDVVFSFSFNVSGSPIINVINYTDRELIIDATGLSFRLADRREVQPTLLRIATGLPGDYLYRSYVTIRPRSAFAIEPNGLDEELKQMESLSIRMGFFNYKMEPVRQEIFDVMLDRLAQVNLFSKSIRRDFRELSIPFKGEKVRAGFPD